MKKYFDHRRGTAALCAALIAAPAYTSASRQQETRGAGNASIQYCIRRRRRKLAGQETLDVTGESVKELKLPAERGVFIDHNRARQPGVESGTERKRRGHRNERATAWKARCNSGG